MRSRRSVGFLITGAGVLIASSFSYGSIYMGRPTMIKDNDCDTPEPHVDPVRLAVLNSTSFF
jgi:hypothetical protein